MRLSKLSEGMKYSRVGQGDWDRLAIFQKIATSITQVSVKDRINLLNELLMAISDVIIDNSQDADDLNDIKQIISVLLDDINNKTEILKLKSRLDQYIRNHVDYGNGFKDLLGDMKPW